MIPSIQTAEGLIASLVALNINTYFVAPGSRSAPLTLAADANPKCQIIQHIDERGLGFAALGFAKHRPCAIIVTSGTAVANLLPAMIEAYYSAVPLFVIAADRPPELIDVGANQAINQKGIFGQFAPSYANLAPRLWGWNETDHQHLSRWLYAGLVSRQPMHLNIQLREPLYNAHTLSAGLYAEVEADDWRFPIAGELAAPEQAPTDYDLVIIGQLPLDEISYWQSQLENSDVQVICDVQANIHLPNALYGIDHYQSQAKFEACLPTVKRVLQVGGMLVSKSLLQWMSRAEKKGIIIEQWSYLPWPPAPLANASLKQIRRSYGDEMQLQSSSLIVSPSEPRWLDAIFTAPSPLFIGNSMTIRLANQWCEPRVYPITSNRGASGIDGLLATAVGVAYANEGHAIAILGDLSSLHDLSSFALLASRDVKLLVVILNDGGGSIFRMLQTGLDADQLDNRMCASHSFNFKGICQQFNLRYLKLEGMALPSDIWAQFDNGSDSMVVECQLDKADSPELFKRQSRLK